MCVPTYCICAVNHSCSILGMDSYKEQGKELVDLVYKHLRISNRNYPYEPVITERESSEKDK